MRIDLVDFHKFICASNALLKLLPSQKMQKSMLNYAVKCSDYTTFQSLIAKSPEAPNTTIPWDSLEFAVSAYEWVRQGNPQFGNTWIHWWNSAPHAAPTTSLEQCHTTLINVLKKPQGFINRQTFEHRILEALECLIKLSSSSISHPLAPPVSDIVLEGFEFSQGMTPWVLEKCVLQYQEGEVRFCSETVRDTMLQKYWTQVDWMASAQLDHQNDRANIPPSWKDMLSFLPNSYAILLIKDHPHIVGDPNFTALFAARDLNEEVTQVAVEHGFSSNMVYTLLSSSKNAKYGSLFECVERCEANRQKKILNSSIESDPTMSAPLKRKI